MSPEGDYVRLGVLRTLDLGGHRSTITYTTYVVRVYIRGPIGPTSPGDPLDGSGGPSRRGFSEMEVLETLSERSWRTSQKGIQ